MSPPADSQPGSRRPVVAPAARGLPVGILLGGGLYMLLIDTTSLPELYVGAVALALASAAFEASRRRGLVGARISLRWLAGAWRPIATVPLDIARLTAEAFAQVARPRPQRGSLRAIPFPYGSATGPRHVGRRALAEAFGSLAPNTIVIGIDEERDLIVAHQLRRSGNARTLDVLDLAREKR